MWSNPTCLNCGHSFKDHYKVMQGTNNWFYLCPCVSVYKGHK